MRLLDIAIIGAGPAGCAAAVQCRRLGCNMALIDRSGRAGGMVANAFQISNYPGLEHPLSGPEFAKRLHANLQSLGIVIEPWEVTRIEPTPGGFAVKGSERAIHATCVICAPGTRPKPLDPPVMVPHSPTRVFFEVRALLARWPDAQRVVIIGAGEAACDYALTLAQRGIRVDIVARRTLKARGRLAEMVQTESRIQIHRGCALERVQLTSLHATAWWTRTGAALAEHVAADALLVAVGRRSALDELMPDLLCHVQDSVTTTMPGLLIAGDARSGALGQIGMAVGDGLNAACLACRALEE